MPKSPTDPPNGPPTDELAGRREGRRQRDAMGQLVADLTRIRRELADLTDDGEITLGVALRLGEVIGRVDIVKRDARRLQRSLEGKPAE